MVGECRALIGRTGRQTHPQLQGGRTAGLLSRSIRGAKSSCEDVRRIAPGRFSVDDLVCLSLFFCVRPGSAWLAIGACSCHRTFRGQWPRQLAPEAPGLQCWGSVSSSAIFLPRIEVYFVGWQGNNLDKGGAGFDTDLCGKLREKKT